MFSLCKTDASVGVRVNTYHVYVSYICIQMCISHSNGTASFFDELCGFLVHEKKSRFGGVAALSPLMAAVATTAAISDSWIHCVMILWITY